MAFIDDLSLVVDLMILVIVIVFYTGLMVWFEMRRKDPVRAVSHLRSGALVLGLLGATLGLIAMWGEFTWTLPASYNLFFYDPMVLLALLLVSFAAAVRFQLPTHLVGLLGAVVGLGVIFYGVRADQLGLTKDVFETYLLYLGFGAVAIGSYPATLFVDWFVVGPTKPGADPLPSSATPNYPWIWRILLGLFLALVVLAGIAAVAYGIDIAWGHLASAP
jgi:putative membrane protein